MRSEFFHSIFSIKGLCGLPLLTLLLFSCAKTVSELHLFERLGLLFERKQIPQIVVNVRISRKTMETLEAARLPCRQQNGVHSFHTVEPR
jgi:hypothetical protein